MIAASPVGEQANSEGSDTATDRSPPDEPPSVPSPISAMGATLGHAGNGRPRSEVLPRVVGTGASAVRQDVVNAVETVAISLLRPGLDSPRLDGENAEHIERLAALEVALPPILVRRATMRVIDGNHRLWAAMLRGRREIDVVFFDGNDESAFVAAVEANSSHGLPLSLADRKAAAARIVEANPTWSDRAIARLTGLSAKTVSSIRRPTADSQQLGGRLGRDGRVRPVDGTNGRLRAAQVIEARPQASLREVARAAGVSPTTARDVRARVRRGEDPLPRRSPPHGDHGGSRPSPVAGSSPVAAAAGQKRAADSEPDPALILEGLRNDPSLRLTEGGRALLRLLNLQVRGLDACRKAAEGIPSHCVYTLAKLARAMGDTWASLASDFERQLE